jgi:hypothetical protein
MVYITWLGQSNNWMEEQRSIEILDSALGELFMDAMKRVACLKGHNIGMARLRQAASGGSRRQSEFFEVEMMRQFKYVQGA